MGSHVFYKQTKVNNVSNFLYPIFEKAPTIKGHRKIVVGEKCENCGSNFVMMRNLGLLPHVMKDKIAPENFFSMPL